MSMYLECDTCGETFDDAVDCWRCRQAATATLRAENARIVAEAKQCHEQNDRLTAEHIALRAQNARLREALKTALDWLDDQGVTGKDGRKHSHDCMGQHGYPCKAWCLNEQEEISAARRALEDG